MSQLTEHACAALRSAELSGQQGMIAEALDHLCMAEFLANHDLDPVLVSRAVALDAEVGTAPEVQHPGIATGRLPLALTLKWTDDFDRARQLLESL